MCHVSIDKLTLTFGKQCLFADFDFCLARGRWTSLLGSSGVGKSTLLRIIANLETNFTGKVMFDKPDGNKNIAYLAQHDALYPWLSVLDNVQLHAHLSGQKTAQTAERAKQLLSQVKMDKHWHKSCHQLSGGQRQRVALARTLMQDADLVLMDEPFSALDAVTRHELQALSHRLLANKTVLLITHDPQEAIRLSDDIYVLKHQPATLSAPIRPQGVPPRTFDDWGQSCASLLTDLLAQLGDDSDGVN